MSDSNAHAEQALKTCLDAVVTAASPKTITAELLAKLATQVRGDFQTRMQVAGVWEAERAKLLQMASYLGTLARFFSDCDTNEPKIYEKHLWKAAKLVQDNCPVGANVNGTRQWCKSGVFQ